MSLKSAVETKVNKGSLVSIETPHHPSENPPGDFMKIGEVAEAAIISSTISRERGAARMTTGLSHSTLGLIQSAFSVENYAALYAENQKEAPSELIVPPRRICNFGGSASGSARLGCMSSVFIKDEEILKVHPMRFLRSSPYVIQDETEIKEDVESMVRSVARSSRTPPWAIAGFDELKKSVFATAVTEADKHVILQQEVNSCFPSCLGMLALDLGKTPDVNAIKNTSDLVYDEQADKMIKDAGFIPYWTDLPYEQDSVAILIRCLSERGSGILKVYDSNLSGHSIILDDISIEEGTAMIRDPFHGWALTIKLDALVPLIKISPSNNINFVQIDISKE